MDKKAGLGYCEMQYDFQHSWKSRLKMHRYRGIVPEKWPIVLQFEVHRSDLEQLGWKRSPREGQALAPVHGRDWARRSQGPRRLDISLAGGARCVSEPGGPVQAQGVGRAAGAPQPHRKYKRNRHDKAGSDLFGCGSIWLWIYLAVGLDLVVDLSPQRNDIDPQRIRSPPSNLISRTPLRDSDCCCVCRSRSARSTAAGTCIP